MYGCGGKGKVLYGVRYYEIPYGGQCDLVDLQCSFLRRHGTVVCE